MNPKLLRNIDYPILIIIILITIISILVISSATHANAPGGDFHYTKMQLLWFCLGLISMICVMMVDYHSIVSWSNIIYVLNIVGLVSVLFLGKKSSGAQRWIPIGPFGFQPSEFAKLAMIIVIARQLDRQKTLDNMKDLVPILLHIAMPLFLIMKQPDLGTSLVLLIILLGMLFIAGISYKMLALIIGAGLASMPLVWSFLKDYQKKRLLVFRNPNLDPLGEGYHVIQSKIAIGSGRLFGKGLFMGTQNQLDFIPEQHTDFIFAVLGEELGFLGGILIFSLYFYLIFRCIKLAYKARDFLGTYIIIGITSMWTFQILINIGMTLGMMPITGIPLPFMSYGGSSFIMNMMAVGLILNIGMRRQKILF